MDSPIEIDLSEQYHIRIKFKYDNELKTLVSSDSNQNGDNDQLSEVSESDDYLFFKRSSSDDSKFFCYYDSVNFEEIKPFVPDILVSKYIDYLKMHHNADPRLDEHEDLDIFFTKLISIDYPIDINDNNFYQFLPKCRYTNDEMISNIENNTYNSRMTEQSCKIFDTVGKILNIIGKTQINVEKAPVNQLGDVYAYVGGWTNISMRLYLLQNATFLKDILGNDAIIRCLLSYYDIRNYNTNDYIIKRPIKLLTNTLISLCHLVIELKKYFRENSKTKFDPVDLLKIKLNVKYGKYCNFRENIVRDLFAIDSQTMASKYSLPEVKAIANQLFHATLPLTSTSSKWTPTSIYYSDLAKIIDDVKNTVIYGKRLEEWKLIEIIELNKYLKFRESKFLSIYNYDMYLDFYMFFKKACTNTNTIDSNNLVMIKRGKQYLCLDISDMVRYFIDKKDINTINSLPKIKDLLLSSNIPNIFNDKLNIDDIKHFGMHGFQDKAIYFKKLHNYINIIYGNRQSRWKLIDLFRVNQYLLFDKSFTDKPIDQPDQVHSPEYVKTQNAQLEKYTTRLDLFCKSQGQKLANIHPFKLVFINGHGLLTGISNRKYQLRQIVCLDITKIMNWFQQNNVDSFQTLPHIGQLLGTPRDLGRKLEPFDILHFSRHPHAEASTYFRNFYENRFGVVYGKPFQQWTNADLNRLNQYLGIINGFGAYGRFIGVNMHLPIMKSELVKFVNNSCFNKDPNTNQTLGITLDTIPNDEFVAIKKRDQYICLSIVDLKTWFEGQNIATLGDLRTHSPFVNPVGHNHPFPWGMYPDEFTEGLTMADLQHLAAHPHQEGSTYFRNLVEIINNNGDSINFTDREQFLKDLTTVLRIGLFMENDYTPTVETIIDDNHEETWPYSQRAVGMFWNLYQGTSPSIKSNFQKMGLLGYIELRTAVCRHIKGAHLSGRVKLWLDRFVEQGMITSAERSSIRTRAMNGVNQQIYDPLNIPNEFKPQTGGKSNKNYVHQNKYCRCLLDVANKQSKKCL